MEESSHLLLNQHAEIEAPERNRMAPTTQPTITRSKHKVLVLIFVVFSIVMGYIAATQPKSKGWRFFSYHPFLMTVGFVGCMGSASVTKKLMGYSNTKIHGILASIGLLLAFGGLYVIYVSKESLGKMHITTAHSLAGIITMAGCTIASMAGGIFLHPDFGMDKTNKTIRFGHKWFSRSMILLGWITCVMGLRGLTHDNPMILALFAVPLMILAPYTLL